MDLSVIIPTHGRPGKLAACVRALDLQTLDRRRYEVLVGIDGPAHDAEVAARDARGSLNLLVEAFSRRGQAAVRNALLPRARGALLVFLNDDMIPGPGFLESHLRAHRPGVAAIVAGDSPWVVHEPDRLFDRLVRESSMVFFHGAMREHAARARPADEPRDWGFRHAWLLNLSIPAVVVREVGAFTVFPSTYGYEDDEIAFRIQGRYRAPVRFAPDAIARHDHRMEPGEYLDREERLGHAAWGFARATPECARAMFGRDVTAPEEVEYSRRFVERERAAAERLEPHFLALADLPASAIDGSHARTLIDLIYGQHLLLKRWRWRVGHLRAAAEASTLRA